MKGLRIIAAAFFAMMLGLLPTEGEAAPGDISTVVGAVAGELDQPYGVALDGSGNLYIADRTKHFVLKLDAGTGTVAPVAGTGSAGFSGDGGPAAQAALSGPESVAVDAAGNLYIADTGNRRIRKIAAATGVISTVAGNGTQSSTGDGGPATAATLNLAEGVAVDGNGNIYIADSFGKNIRRVAAATGIISTVTSAGTLTFPTGVAVDAAGNLYVADNMGSMVWKIAGGTGARTAVAGTGTSDINNPASLVSPNGVTVDGSGTVYIAELSSRVRKVTAGGLVTVAGTGNPAFSGDGGTATDAELQRPRGVAIDSAGNIFIADTGNKRIRKVLGNDPPVVTVAPDGGTYSSTLLVDLSVDRPAILYYTLDGSLPTLTSESFSGAGQLPVESSTTLRYFARDLDGNESAVTTQSYAIVPGAPGSVLATAGAGKATVSFTPPAFTAGTITTYRVTSSPGNISATGSASPIVVNGLSAGTPYTFTVTASNATGSGPASATSNSVTPTGSSYPLTLTFAGTGGGSVNGGLSCTSGSSCAPVQFNPNTQVVLLATADANSTFGSWSAPCVVSGTSCTVTMNSVKSVTATFLAAPKARIVGGASYSLLAEAYAAAAANAVIQARSVLFSDGILTLNRAIALRLNGGYDASFGTRPGRTTIQGKLLIRSGTLRADGVAIR